MRSLAALGFLWAAFDWPFPGLDRAGLAFVALALLALALPAKVRMRRPAIFGPMEPMNVPRDDLDPRLTAMLADADDDER